MVDGTLPNTTQHPRDHTTMSHKLELPGVCHGGGMKPLAAGPQDYTTMLHKQHTNMVPQDALRMLSPRAAGSRTTTACTTDCCPDIRRTCPAKGGIKVDPVVLCPITSVRFGHLELVFDLHVLPIHDEMEKEKIRRAVR